MKKAYKGVLETHRSYIKYIPELYQIALSWHMPFHEKQQIHMIDAFIYSTAGDDVLHDKEQSVLGKLGAGIELHVKQTKFCGRLACCIR